MALKAPLLAMTGSLYTQKPPTGRPRVLLEQDKAFGVRAEYYQRVNVLGRAGRSNRL